jgi:hypothetical protein
MEGACSPSSATPSDRSDAMIAIMVCAMVGVFLGVVGLVGYFLDRSA